MAAGVLDLALRMEVEEGVGGEGVRLLRRLRRPGPAPPRLFRRFARNAVEYEGKISYSVEGLIAIFNSRLLIT